MNYKGLSYNKKHNNLTQNQLVLFILQTASSLTSAVTSGRLGISNGGIGRPIKMLPRIPVPRTVLSFHHTKQVFDEMAFVALQQKLMSVVDDYKYNGPPFSALAAHLNQSKVHTSSRPL